MTLSVSGHDIDYRVSSLPTAHGENIVLRVLDRSRGIVALDELGMSPPRARGAPANDGTPGGA